MIATSLVVFVGFVVASSTALFVYLKHIATVPYVAPQSIATSRVVEKTVPPVFPVGVDPKNERIIENPVVDAYFEAHVSLRGGSGGHTGWLHKALNKLALAGWFQNMASLSTRLLVIDSGERKEQIADHFGKILAWDKSMRTEFLTRVETADPELTEGKFSPGNYTVSRDATPADVAPLIVEKFGSEVSERYTPEIEAIVPLVQTLTIASLLEREAYDFDDMRQISGVIWNRLFADMNLQIDATLQYAKGSNPNEPWWPRVQPGDKYINSPFNTYKNEGLPPAPIANPSLDAILAALNPKKTNCMYYFHDKHGNFHCSATYEEHVAGLKEYYGKGK